MISRNWGYLALGILLAVSCKQSPYIHSFDSQSWQLDTNGCQGLRLEQLGILMDEQESLLGWSEQKLTEYLGSPDYRELYVRNQKFLIYYLEPTADCGTEGKENPLRLYLRLDALGAINEISFRNQ